MKPSEGPAENILADEISERASKASEKVRQKSQNTFIPRLYLFEDPSVAREWLRNIQDDFRRLARNPDDESGAGNYQGWTTAEIKELYFVLYGKAMDSESDDSSEIPQYLVEAADQTIEAFKNYKGPQARYLMYDYVAMAKGAWHLTSKYSDGPLSAIRHAPQYADWNDGDFAVFLDLLKEDEHLAKIITSVTEEIEENLAR